MNEASLKNQSWMNFQIVPGFRVRIIPVLGTIPAIFGQVMASYVVTQLAGLQVQPEPVVNLDTDHYRVLHQRLIEHEESLYGTAVGVEVCISAYCLREEIFFPICVWKLDYPFVLAINSLQI